MVIRKKCFGISAIALIFSMAVIGCELPDNLEKQAPSVPTLVTAGALSQSSISIYWNKVPDADSYDVYYAEGYSEEKNFIANTSNVYYTHTGLQANKYYYYYIKAKNNNGESDFSYVASAQTFASRLSTPTAVTAAALSENSIGISWSAVTGAASYDVYYTIGDSSGEKNFIANTSETSYTHTELEEDTSYYYYIKAVKNDDKSDFSSFASATTGDLKAPSSPTSVKAEALSQSRIGISWNAVPGADSYDVYYAATYSGEKNFITNISETSYTHTGLNASTYYYYYIKAKNNEGESSFSSYVSAKTLAAISAPTSVKAEVLSQTSIGISWKAVTGADSYDIYCANGSSSADKILVGNTSAISYTHTGLLINKNYYYYIKAKNDESESGFSSVASAKIAAPDAPTVKAQALSQTSISISWKAVTGATSYDVYYEAPSSTDKILAGNTSATSYTHTGLNKNTLYKYYVKAKNSYSESAFSSPASATTKEFAEKTFWTIDFNTGYYKQINAELLAEGDRCNVWVQKDNVTDKTKAKDVADEYDFKIYPKLNDAFGVPLNYDGESFSGPMELADCLADNDEKLTILIVSMGAGVDGYFWSGDMVEYEYDKYAQFSNHCDMIHINATENSEVSLTTIAHETQHIMNCATGYALRGGENAGQQQAWINEGLSAAAEWIYSGEHNQERIGWFNFAYSLYEVGRIPFGNNFFVWDNEDYRSDPNAVLDDYATVYLFFQWLRLQADSSSIYKTIISSNYRDYKAVTTTMNTAIPGQGYNNWDTLLGNWLIANAANAPTGPYGYKNDIIVYVIGILGPGTLSLAPGEGVYSKITDTAVFDKYTQGPNIKNIFLDPVTWEPVDSPIPNNFMITYNTNTNGTGKREPGIVASMYKPTTNIPEIRSSRSFNPNSFKIDARDLLRRNGMEKSK